MRDTQPLCQTRTSASCSAGSRRRYARTGPRPWRPSTPRWRSTTSTSRTRASTAATTGSSRGSRAGARDGRAGARTSRSSGRSGDDGVIALFRIVAKGGHSGMELERDDAIVYRLAGRQDRALGVLQRPGPRARGGQARSLTTDSAKQAGLSWPALFLGEPAWRHQSGWRALTLRGRSRRRGPRWRLRRAQRQKGRLRTASGTGFVEFGRAWVFSW